MNYIVFYISFAIILHTLLLVNYFFLLIGDETEVKPEFAIPSILLMSLFWPYTVFLICCLLVALLFYMIARY